MKRFIISILLLVSVFSATAQTPHWNNLGVCQENRETPHVRRFPYASLLDLQKLNYQSSPNYRCLDGTWDFYYVEDPSQAPKPANGLLTLPNTSPRSIQVPGNMELQGFGTPVYVNVSNEFKSNPPFAPTKYNPVGLYVREFEVEESWTNGDPVFFHIGAVKSCCYLYVNDQYVGYSEDSKTAAEFEISRYLKSGKNRVAVQVYRFCTGSYLECQDMWRMSGITRSVSLYRVPKTYVKDYSVNASLEEKDWMTGLLDVVIKTSLPSEKKMTLSAKVLDKEGNVIAQAKKALSDTLTHFANEDFNLGKIQPWTDKNPYLYTLAISIFNAKGDEQELVGGKIGFRKIDIRKIDGYNLFCLNGVPVEIRGVNRHEHSGTSGHFVSPSLMRKDVELMKQANINAVRTSHYPCDELWYDLCDSAGIMLWDESNVESHAQGYGDASLAKNEDWIPSMIFRCNNMFQRDKNHPSVIAWSLGNECGNGVCTEATYRFMKEQDSTRPVTYERAEYDWNTDVVEIMYPSVDYIGRYARKAQASVDSAKTFDIKTKEYRPYIIAEYCHAMGNSLGSLKDYWDTIDRYPVLQGGFIWDWVDQSIVQKDEKGRNWYAVGGDLGTIPDCGDDDAFCANGLISSDRIPHQHYYHCQQVYGKKQLVDLFEREKALPRGVHLRMTGKWNSTIVKKDSIWTISETPKHNEDGSLQNYPFSLRLNIKNGQIESFQREGREFISAPIRPNFWRPPTLNDLVDRNGASAWRGLDKLHYELLDCSVKREDHCAGLGIELTYRLSNEDGQAMMMREIVRINKRGAVCLHFRLEPQGSFRTLPKMGVQLGLDKKYKSLFASRATADEVYPDRYHEGDGGLKDLDCPIADIVGEMHIVPQESGNRKATALTFSQGEKALDTKEPRICIESYSSQLNYSVREYEDSTLSRCTRINQLPDPLPYYVVSLDYKQAGLGSATCGPGVRNPYILSGDSVYTYSFFFDFADEDYKKTAAFSRPLRLDDPLPSVRKESPIKAVNSIVLPEKKYGKDFPQNLYDGKLAVAGDYGHDWAGFYGQDSVVLDIELKGATDINAIVLGACNAPNDWVLLPKKVEFQWSKNGKSYSEWNELNLPQMVLSAGERNALISNPNLANDRQRKRFLFKADKTIKKVRNIRLRIYPQPLLPETHNYAGEKAWLMIDEVEVN